LEGLLIVGGEGAIRGWVPLVFFLLEAFCVVAFVSLLLTLLFVPVLMIKIKVDHILEDGKER
jgi:hypothetical protein